MCTTRKGPESEWLARDSPETHPITIKPKTESHMAEQISWVPWPSCSPPRHPFPVKSLALSARVASDNSFLSVKTRAHFRAPEGVPPCNRAGPPCLCKGLPLLAISVFQGPQCKHSRQDRQFVSLGFPLADVPLSYEKRGWLAVSMVTDLPRISSEWVMAGAPSNAILSWNKRTSRLWEGRGVWKNWHFQSPDPASSSLTSDVI